MVTVVCRMYGGDWDQVGATSSLAHTSANILVPERFSLEPGHCQPARPFV